MASWKDIDWHEKWQVIDRILAMVGERVDQEHKQHLESLSKRYDIATEARASEAGTVIAIIQGMRNNLWDIEKKI